jgi:release factor glutamine methyltransferase
MQTTIPKIKEVLSPLYSTGEIKNIIRIIFENIKNYSQVDIIMNQDEILSQFIKDKVDMILKRLVNHEPIQYIFNEAYFQGLTLKVTPDTLIPRPETEELIDIIVKENNQSDLHVLDIGTGSGAIAIALAKSLKFPIVDAIDISQKAIDIAQENAKAHKVKINFFIRDILSAEIPTNSVYDIIVSNPPYITLREKDSMEPNVLDYEPHTALFVPDNDPLMFYRAITHYAVYALNPGGRIYFEINSLYGKETAKLLSDNNFIDVDIIKDMYGLDRFVSAAKPKDYAY